MPSEPCSVVLRADASATIGLGHVMRSLTLARALADTGCRVTFRVSGLPARERARIEDAPIAVIDIPEPDTSVDDARATGASRPGLVVVDGYHFTGEYFSTLEAAGVPYAVIDDNAETNARRPIAIINQNPHASAGLYEHLGSSPTLLLGLEYALIRPEITAVAEQGLARTPRTVFVAMGGSDPLGLTVPIAAALADRGLEMRVAVGPAVPRRDGVVDELLANENIEVVDPDDYEVTLATCEIAVLAAGSSLWEASVLRTPTVALIVAANQEDAARSAELLRVITPDDLRSGIGHCASLILRCRSQLEDRATDTIRRGVGVDGLGSIRVSAGLLELVNEGSDR